LLHTCLMERDATFKQASPLPEGYEAPEGMGG
jgi:hypothetical protein